MRAISPRLSSSVLFRLACAWSGALLIGACGDDNNSSDKGAGGNSATQTAAQQTKETLLLQKPPGWLEVTSQATDAFRLAEFAPVGQSNDQWFDKLFVESNNLEPLPDPIAFLAAMGEELKTECDGASDANIHSGLENGYEVSVRLLVCNKNLTSARGEVSLVKAIKGNDNFYVISRARRSEPLQTDESPLTKREMGEWSLYLRSVKLCDPRLAAHPCPV